MIETNNTGLTAVVRPSTPSGPEVARKETEMSANEQDRVNHFNSMAAHGNSMASKLIWDPVSKRIRPVGCHELNPSGLVITPSDMRHSGA